MPRFCWDLKWAAWWAHASLLDAAVWACLSPPRCTMATLLPSWWHAKLKHICYILSALYRFKSDVRNDFELFCSVFTLFQLSKTMYRYIGMIIFTIMPKNIRVILSSTTALKESYAWWWVNLGLADPAVQIKKSIKYYLLSSSLQGCIFFQNSAKSITWGDIFYFYSKCTLT